MIRCRRQHFEQLCRNRGTTLNAVIECVARSDGDILTVDPLHPSYPRHGLGDMVADGLAAVGITKERVSALVGRDCGCQQRQELLNQVGYRLGIGTQPDEPPA
jgi:hypothetical protein